MSNLVDDVVTPYRGLYLCSRTSLGVLSNAQPCEEAKRVLVRTRAGAYMEEYVGSDSDPRGRFFNAVYV